MRWHVQILDVRPPCGILCSNLVGDQIDLLRCKTLWTSSSVIKMRGFLTHSLLVFPALRLPQCIRRDVLLAHVSIREAEEGFVDSDHLEAGETLIQAIKAFDEDARFLCAGALLRREASSDSAPVHDCWIADSVEPGVGPNLQLQGAQLVLDELFLLHIQRCHLESNGGGGGGGEQMAHGGVDCCEFNVLAGTGEGTTAASRAAALSRGFTSEVECSDSGEVVLRFGVDGANCYQNAAKNSPTARQVYQLLQRKTAARRHTPASGGTAKVQPRWIPKDLSMVAGSTGGGGGSALSLEAVIADLCSNDWQPLTMSRSRWRHPCLLSSLLTAFSVACAARRSLFVPFGVGPLAVLASSILYWIDPVKESPRRTIDLITVRTGLACQVLLACRFCAPAGLALLLGGYGIAMACYAAGRLLTVRGRQGAGAFVHCGVHVFANLGNLMLLRFTN